MNHGWKALGCLNNGLEGYGRNHGLLGLNGLEGLNGSMNGCGKVAGFPVGCFWLLPFTGGLEGKRRGPSRFGCPTAHVDRCQIGFKKAIPLSSGHGSGSEGFGLPSDKGPEDALPRGRSKLFKQIDAL